MGESRPLGFIRCLPSRRAAALDDGRVDPRRQLSRGAEALDSRRHSRGAGRQTEGNDERRRVSVPSGRAAPATGPACFRGLPGAVGLPSLEGPFGRRKDAARNSQHPTVRRAKSAHSTQLGPGVLPAAVSLTGQTFNARADMSGCI